MAKGDLKGHLMCAIMDTLDHLILFNYKKFLDYEIPTVPIYYLAKYLYLKEIYPSQITVEKTNKSDHLADYLDLTSIIDSGGKLSSRLHDKRDEFDFHIVNFPFLSSNINITFKDKS